jgi:hypothetical protein
MSTSIIPQLIRKDLLMSRKIIMMFCLVSLASIGMLGILFGRIPNWVLVNVAFLLLVAPAATCGIVLLMKTNVFEKEKSTQSFIMSLPITVKEFTVAKLLVNLPVFCTFWLAVTVVAFYFSFGLGLFPPGAAPFITMVFLGVFAAYTCILSTSLLSQNLGTTVLSIMIFEIGTSAYLWIIAFLDPIARHIYGPEAIWNSAAVTIVVIQALTAVGVLVMTLGVQIKKRDFV